MESIKSWECLVSCAVIVQRVEADLTGPYVAVASGQADATMNTYGVSKPIAKDCNRRHPDQTGIVSGGAVRARHLSGQIAEGGEGREGREGVC